MNSTINYGSFTFILQLHQYILRTYIPNRLSQPWMRLTNQQLLT